MLLTICWQLSCILIVSPSESERTYNTQRKFMPRALAFYLALSIALAIYNSDIKPQLTFLFLYAFFFLDALVILFE